MRRAVLILWLLVVSGTAHAATVWKYTVKASADAATLSVTALLQSPETDELSVNDKAEPYVRQVELFDGAHWHAVPRRGDSWFLPARSGSSPLLRYQFALKEAATELDASDTARLHAGACVCNPGCFLLRPLKGEEADVHFTVSTQSPIRCLTGFARTSDGAWAVPAGSLFMGPDVVFGQLSLSELHLPGSDVRLVWMPHTLALSDAQLKAWAMAKLQAVARYFGKLPIRQGLIIVLPGHGDSVHGEAKGGGGFSVDVGIGDQMTLSEVSADWTFTHEMVHVCTPSLPAPQHWMEEGIATYLEPIIRVRVGDLTPEKVWHDMIEGMPQGEPKEGDRGLNHTHTWGRTYWGGAMFWLLADVQIRERTGGRKSLRDALMGMNHDGANIALDWTPEQVLASGDRATGVPVLRELYASMADHPKTVDLDALYKKLGVKLAGDTAAFFTAPESALRTSMTAP